MKRLGEDIHRYRWIMLSVLCLALFLRWWGMRGKPERLADLPGPWPGSYAVHDGQVYWLTVDRKLGATLLTTPVEGGRVREISRLDLSDGTSSGLTATDAGLMFTVTRTVLQPTWIEENARRKSSPPYPTGPLGRPRAYSTGPPRPVAGRRPATIVLRQAYIVPYDGSPTLILPPPVSSDKKVLRSLDYSCNPVHAGGHWYWSEMRLVGGRLVRTGGGNSTLLVPEWRSSLMAIPSNGREARAVLDNVRGSRQLYQGETGVLWTASSTEADKGIDLYYLPAGTSSPRLVRHFGNDRFNPARPQVLPYFNLTSVVEQEGRLYFLRQYSPGFTQHASAPTRAMTCRLDGSDYQELPRPAFDSKRPGEIVDLITSHGRVYLVIAVEGAAGHSRKIFAVDQANPARAELAATVGPSMHSIMYDNRYVYHIQTEDREKSWFDWSSEGLRVKTTPILFRLPLKR